MRVLTLFLMLVSYASGSFTSWGYLPEYRYGGVDFDAAMKHLTHLILFSLEVSPDGTLEALDRMPNQNQLQLIQEGSQKYGTKVVMSLGGYGRTNGFASAVQPKNREHFLNQLRALCTTNRFHGIDFNWEYPTNQKEWVHLFETMSEFKKTTGLLVTIAIYPGQEKILASYGQYVDPLDAIHVMAYDQVPGEHSSKSWTARISSELVRAGIPAAKFTLGLPYYARHIKSGEAKTYGEMLAQYPDDVKGGLDKAGPYFWNCPETLKWKVDYAHRLGMGGVMIWEVAQDISASDPLSLLKATAEAVAVINKEKREL